MDARPLDDCDRTGLPHDPPVTASCPACGWRVNLCHCPEETP